MSDTKNTGTSSNRLTSALLWLYAGAAGAAVGLCQNFVVPSFFDADHLSVVLAVVIVPAVLHAICVGSANSPGKFLLVTLLVLGISLTATPILVQQLTVANVIYSAESLSISYALVVATVALVHQAIYRRFRKTHFTLFLFGITGIIMFSFWLMMEISASC